MDAYGKYAPFYDDTQSSSGDASYLRLLKKHHPDAETLLELACGTGANLLSLSKFYTVSGLDSSPAMLRIARKKVPGVKLYLQDMSSFRIKGKFDAIIIPYDSVNHVRRFSDWVRIFRGAKRHLNRGGLFAFDANTPHRLRTLVGAEPFVTTFGRGYMIMNIFDAGRGVTEWDIKVFERVQGNQYQLHHQVIQEVAFDHRRIVAALRGVFPKVKTYDGNGRHRLTRSSGRIFYVCRNAA